MRYLILDLETCAIEGADQFIDPPSAPSNYKDPDKIAAYVAEERQKLVDRAALDLDLARVACLGYSFGNERRVINSFKNEDEERAGLTLLFNMIAADRNTIIVTFNGRTFDLPLLQRRAWYLGLPPFKPNLDRYRSPHLDLYEALTMNGAVKAHGLSWYIKRLGWTDLAGTMPGSQVPQAIRDGKWAEVEAHCAADVQATERLARWLGLLPKEQEPPMFMSEAAEQVGF